MTSSTSRTMKVILRAFPVVGIPMTAWGLAAIYYSPLPSRGLRAVVAVLFVVTAVLIFFTLRGLHSLFLFLLVFVVPLGLFLSVRPSNERAWQPEVAVTPYADINGDLVTIHGVRNFDYRSDTDFSPRWETRTYDLGKLDSIDLIAVY